MREAAINNCTFDYISNLAAAEVSVPVCVCEGVSEASKKYKSK